MPHWRRLGGSPRRPSATTVPRQHRPQSKLYSHPSRTMMAGLKGPEREKRRQETELHRRTTKLSKKLLAIALWRPVREVLFPLPPEPQTWRSGAWPLVWGSLTMPASAWRLPPPPCPCLEDLPPLTTPSLRSPPLRLRRKNKRISKGKKGGKKKLCVSMGPRGAEPLGGRAAVVFHRLSPLFVEVFVYPLPLPARTYAPLSPPPPAPPSVSTPSPRRTGTTLRRRRCSRRARSERRSSRAPRARRCEGEKGRSGKGGWRRCRGRAPRARRGAGRGARSRTVSRRAPGSAPPAVAVSGRAPL